MAELIISKRSEGNVTILNLNGDVTFGTGNVVLRSAIRNALAANEKYILLNFSDVRFIDSSGVGELVSGLTAVNRENGQLKLLNLPRRVRELLEITHLLTIFDAFENEVEAVKSFK
ncbi:MAG TPA: STAS domain-containing protein [Pyrinomonadaceae bacterium]|jgi:anti-sigma B factor antagonist